MTDLWINKPSILFNNLNQFFISNELSENENKNAIVRFGIYLAILILLFDQDKEWLLLSIIIILSSLLYNKKNIDSFLNTQIKELFTQQSKCYKPNKDNPFMNYTIGDLIETPLREPACNYQDVKDDVKKEYKKHIKTDTYDIWGKNTSDRNFYTLPNTNIVNDQTKFAKWCFGDSGRCKTVGENCLKFKDPLYHRHVHEQLETKFQVLDTSTKNLNIKTLSQNEQLGTLHHYEQLGTKFPVLDRMTLSSDEQYGTLSPMNN